ncbi:MAG TPA: cysteine synthase family protein [Bacteroidales bacterium]|nr:cysteine synthase family protein [Bacteroidales bacterium]
MKNLLETIGNTPIIQLNNIIKSTQVKLFAKLEGQNPGGSIKDRAALYMIEQAEKRGELKKGMTILEASSGNMGISLAMIGTFKGYKVTIIMSEGMSEERRIMIKALGADLILTNKEKGTEGAILKAKELINKYPEKYWFVNQFNNEDNVLSHYHGIASEILSQIPNIDYIISGIGTSGTIMGIAKKIKSTSPKTKIVGVYPPSGYKIQGIQNPNEDFKGDIYNSKLVDILLNITSEEAFQIAKLLAQTEGLFVGMSSGAVVAAALKLASLNKNGSMLVILPDRGEKYVSTNLYK